MWEFPELEDEGRGQLLAQEVHLPYNYFQRVENDHDEVHTHYTHKFMPSFGLLDVPRMSARETEYGMKSIATYPGSQVYEHHFYIPTFPLRHTTIHQDPPKITI